MKLFYVPGACSLADHIALLEVGLPFELVRVERSLATDKQTSDGRAFRSVNPKGYVPALELDDGSVLTENLALLVWIAEQRGSLLPSDGLARARVLEALAFMTSEVHGNFKPLFFPDASAAEKDRGRANLARHFAMLAEQLGDRAFLVGDTMTIADAYLFVMGTWCALHGLVAPERIVRYVARMREVPSVARALAAEGLA
jgi:glutathione S-transferase